MSARTFGSRSGRAAALVSVAAASALLLSVGTAPAVSAVRGPSGELAISATYAAGQNPQREHEEVASPRVV
jgi:hypothetical protein